MYAYHEMNLFIDELYVYHIILLQLSGSFILKGGPLDALISYTTYIGPKGTLCDKI